jgi:hypothetical protein
MGHAAHMAFKGGAPSVNAVRAGNATDVQRAHRNLAASEKRGANALGVSRSKRVD